MIAQENTPQYKIEPVGFINMLQSQNKPAVLRLNNEAGHKNSVQVKYKQRWTKDFTSDTIDCNVTNVPAYKEAAVDLSSTRALNLNFEDERIMMYEDDASKTTMKGQPATPFMNEVLDEIMTAATALLQAVNTDLLTTLSGNIGVNRRTGNNAAAAINIARNSTNNPLSDGLNQMLADYINNGGAGTPQVFGSGLFQNFMLNQGAKGIDQAGLNTSIQAAGMKWYHDLDAQAVFGADQIVVVQPNSVQLVEFMMNTGFKAGYRGTSSFGIIALPLQIGADVLPMMFDFQMKYSDCSQVLEDQYYGSSITVQRGFNLMISKQCGLFTIPSDAYRGTDPLVGNRGTLRYTISNACDNC